MKNRIIVLGNENFQREVYKDGFCNLYNDNKYLNTLYKKYDIDNFSNAKLTSEKALSFLKIFTKIYKYDACVLVLGDSDISDNKTCDLEKNLDEIVSLLISFDIKPVIINDKNYYNNYEALEKKIEKLLKKYKINLAKENSDKLNLKYGF